MFIAGGRVNWIMSTKRYRGSEGRSPHRAAVSTTPIPIGGSITYFTMITATISSGLSFAFHSPVLLSNQASRISDFSYVYLWRTREKDIPTVRLPPSMRVILGMVPSLQENHPFVQVEFRVVWYLWNELGYNLPEQWYRVEDHSEGSSFTYENVVEPRHCPKYESDNLKFI